MNNLRIVLYCKPRMNKEMGIKCKDSKVIGKYNTR